MAIAPDDFLQAAEDLDNGVCIEADEPRARTICGRLYYASYLAVREAIRDELNDPGFDPRGHKVLSKTLKSASDPEVSQLGSALDQLRKKRDTSDYYLSRSVPPNDATLQLINARHVVGRAAGLASQFPTIPRK